jgi:hypothetical protein
MKGAGHDQDPEECDRRDRYRYRQELVSRRRPGWTWAVALRQKWSHGQVEARLANMPRCLIGMEACVGRIISAAASVCLATMPG